jgi:hypothetical protein
LLPGIQGKACSLVASITSSRSAYRGPWIDSPLKNAPGAAEPSTDQCPATGTAALTRQPKEPTCACLSATRVNKPRTGGSGQ